MAERRGGSGRGCACLTEVEREVIGLGVGRSGGGGGGDVTGFGESLLAGHWGLSELYEVSCPESDAVVEFAAGHPAAKGARQMGGGFGGCILAVVEDARADDFVDELQQDYFDKFGISLEPLAVGIGPGARVVS